MSPGHEHGSGMRAGARHVGRLRFALVVTLAFMAVEVVAAFLTGSLALLSDAAEMLTDAVGIGMAVAAISLASRAARRPSDSSRTFGLYRLEILAALANAVLLLGVAGYLLVEAGRRLGDEPDVDAGPMLVVGGAGLAVNVLVFLLLRAGARESLNVEGAYLEVLADTLGSVGVVVAAIVMQTTGLAWVDPVFGLGIGLFVLPRTWRLGRKALRVLIQAAPPDIDVTALQDQLTGLEGVASAHDLHVWTLTSGMEVGSVHLRLEPGSDNHDVLDRARRLLREKHGIAHATVQVEPADHAGCVDCERTGW